VSAELAMADDTRKGLGKGLSALLGDAAEDYTQLDKARPSKDVPIEFLRPSRYQPRLHFDETALGELVASIREHGILQPILVRRVEGAPDAYEIVAGERRWRAAQRAQLTQVPVIIKDFNDTEALEVALIENIQRADLSPIEEAKGYERLLGEFGRTQEQVAQLVGKSRSHVANTLRLRNLPAEVQDMLDRGELTAGHGRTLLTAADPLAMARDIVAGGMNVRQAEAVSAKAKRSKSGTKSPGKDPNTRELEENLTQALGLAVEIAFKGEKKGGHVKISYRTLEQLDEICQRLAHHVGKVN
jgi:ParB family chromosome partitioning protein